MKKLLFLLIMICAGAVASAQTTAADYYISGYGTKGVTNTTASTVVAATSYVYKVSIQAPYYYAYSIKLTDNSGSNTASVVVSASVDGVGYKTLATIAYKGTGTDTTIIAAVSTAIPYNYIKYTVTPSDTIWVKNHWLTALPIAR